jgi:hypothetical protein
MDQTTNVEKFKIEPDPNNYDWRTPVIMQVKFKIKVDPGFGIIGLEIYNTSKVNTNYDHSWCVAKFGFTNIRALASAPT